MRMQWKKCRVPERRQKFLFIVVNTSFLVLIADADLKVLSFIIPISIFIPVVNTSFLLLQEFDSAQELLKKVISNVGKEKKAQEIEIQELRREDEERMRQMEDEILSLQNKVDELNTRNIRSDIGLVRKDFKYFL